MSNWGQKTLLRKDYLNLFITGRGSPIVNIQIWPGMNGVWMDGMCFLA